MGQLPILKRACLAYIDTLHSGLVPCKIVRIETDKRQDGKIVAHVVARVTAPRYAYKQGEIVTSEHHGRIVPRSAVRQFMRRGYSIVLPFYIQRDEEVTA